MATVQSSTELSRQLAILDANDARGDYEIDGRHQSAINRFQDIVLPMVAPVLETLSSTLVALSYTDGATGTFRLSLQGSGIGPVSSLEALQSAIETGVATGALGSVTLTNNEVTILTLTLAPGGYTVTSGVDLFRVTGTMPTTFAQMTELAGLLGQLDTDTIAMMSPAERSTYFSDLSAYGLTGFAVESEGREILSLAITAAGATLRAGGLTVTLAGTLPDDFGTIAALLYEVYAEFDSIGQPIDLSGLSGLGVDSLVITDATGAELLRLSGPITTGDSITRHTITGSAGDDATDLNDLPFGDVPDLVANLLGGNDFARINLNDLYRSAVFGGIPAADLPRITLDGGAGTDMLEVRNYSYGSGVMIDLATGRIEGVNLLAADPNNPVYTVTATNFEDVALMGSGHNVLGSAANNTVRIANTYWQSFGDLFFYGAGGIDTLDLSGVFRNNEGFSYFTGVDRETLTSQYEIAADGSGGIAFSPLVNSFSLPAFRLLDVEQLVLKAATGTETVSVASLAPTSYQVFGGETFRGSYLSERITGTEEADTIYGMDGTDTLIGGMGDDFLYGGATNADLRDVIFGGDGDDYIDGGWGNDELHGGEGNDTILGGFGSDTVIGNAGDDLLAGGAGSDLMFGGPGNDTLNGGWGYDRLNGGAGADRFFHQGVADHASDWIQDYNAAEGDVLVFGLAGATRAQFQVNIQTTPGAGASDVAEAFVIYRPTGQIMWALVDGDAQTEINLLVGGQIYDLLT